MPRLTTIDRTGRSAAGVASYSSHGEARNCQCPRARALDWLKVVMPGTIASARPDSEGASNRVALSM